MTRRYSRGEDDGESGDLGDASQGVPKATIDHTDREILRVLQVDGRTSNSEVARRLGVTETTVRKRLAAMLESDLVSIVAVPTPRLAGLTVSAIIRLSGELESPQKGADPPLQPPGGR